MTNPDQATEAAIVAAGANVAPRITTDNIEANITSEHYFTAAHGVHGTHEVPGNPEAWSVPDALRLLTFCVLVLKNGFTVTGESACASPENYNKAIGERIARENAVAKIWPLMGYALKDRMVRAAD